MLRFATINIEGHRHLSQVRAFVQDLQPQIVCLQEANDRDVAELAKLFNAQSCYVPLGKSPEEIPSGFEVNGSWGLAILSTFPVHSITHQFYKGTGETPTLTKGQPNVVDRALLMNEIETPEGLLKIATTHFTWTPDGTTTDEQQRDFAALSSLLEKLQPDLICGDFNAARGMNPVFDTLAERYKDNIPPSVTTTIDQQLHKVKGLQLVVDGVFTTPKVEASNVTVHSGVSDHCAVSATLSFL